MKLKEALDVVLDHWPLVIFIIFLLISFVFPPS